MRVLLDQGLPYSAASILTQQGIDTLHVGDIGASSATDEEIVQIARNRQMVIVTLDADFHAILALSGQHSPSVIRIRVEGLRAEWLASLLQMVIERCREQLASGALVTVTENKLRVRRLPIA